MTQSVIEAITALEEALEAGPTQEWHDCGGFTPGYGALTSDEGYIIFGYADPTVHKEHGKPIKAPTTDKQFANRRFIAAANPLAIRTLLDAHAGALRDAEAMREALESVLSICNETRQARDLQPRMTEIRASARTALATNTKGAAE